MKHKNSLFLIAILVFFSGCENDNSPKGNILLSIDGQTYRMDDNLALYKLMPFKSFSALNARWSPNGKKIVFSTNKNSSTSGPSLYIMDSDGQNARPLSELSDGSPLPGYAPAWSPDGKNIVFALCLCEGGGYAELYIMNLESKNISQLTNNNYPDGLPQWSPDGSTIIFQSSDKDSIGAVNLYSINPSNNQESQITFNRGRTATWNSDGSYLAYYSINDTSVHIMNYATMQDSSTIRIVLGNEILSPVMAWSADDSAILFISNTTDGSAQQHLNQLDLKSHTIKRLLENLDHVSWIDILK